MVAWLWKLWGHLSPLHSEASAFCLVSSVHALLNAVIVHVLRAALIPTVGFEMCPVHWQDGATTISEDRLLVVGEFRNF